MTPMDAGNGTAFYATPRFVTHIDDNAIIALRQYYDQVLPRRGRILDFCSSWISHYPPRIEDAVLGKGEGEEGEGDLAVLGTGMNERELAKNLLMNVKGKRWVVQDLNVDPDVKLPEQGIGLNLDAATCVVSIDYLTRPVQVLASIRQQMNEGGTVHLVISNRCFPTKVVGRWLKVGEEERLEMVGDYLWWSGWREVEIVEVVRKGEGWLDLKDPLWVVRGRNLGERGREREGF